jgi:hypothetical protein
MNVADLERLTHRWPGGTIKNEAEVYSGYYTEAASVLQTYLCLSPLILMPDHDKNA